MHGTIPSEKPEQPKPVAEKRRTITLTNRAPISIIEKDWPVIAQGIYDGGEPAHGIEATIEIRVRQNKVLVSQHIIHANFCLDLDDPESAESGRVGRIMHFLVEGDLWKAISETGDEMRQRISNETFRKNVTVALDRCFAALKPEAISSPPLLSFDVRLQRLA